MSLSSNNGSTFMCVVDRLLCHSFMCGGAVNGRWLAAGGQDRHRTTGVYLDVSYQISAGILIEAVQAELRRQYVAFNTTTWV